MKLMQRKTVAAITASPPSRGAWIEIADSVTVASPLASVAPLAGGVD